MKKMALLLLVSSLTAQPIIEFDGETFLVDNHPVQHCLLDERLKHVQTAEQFESYTSQGGRFYVVRYGDNEYGLTSNGTLNGGGPVLGRLAWGTVKALGLAPDAIARKVAKKKAHKDEKRIARGEAPHHEHKDHPEKDEKSSKQIQGFFDKLADAAQEYCNKLPTP